MSNPQLFLIIKGQRCHAEAEITRRGIEFTFEAESRNGNETYGYAPVIDKPKIIAWYSEDTGLAIEYAKGSLLWYTERK